MAELAAVVELEDAANEKNLGGQNGPLGDPCAPRVLLASDDSFPIIKQTVDGELVVRSGRRLCPEMGDQYA